MKDIEKLSRKIEDEICDAKEYATMALEYREKEPELAKLLYAISTEEMTHMSKLHAAVVALIEKYRKEHGDPPVAMQAVYDILHERNIKNAGSVKALQTLFLEG